MSCSDNWYETVFYPGETFAVLQPKRMICIASEESSVTTGEEEENTVSPALIQFAAVMMMQLYLGSLIILFILYRSCSRKRTDAFRLVFMYLIGTIGFALSLNFGPSSGGFTKLLGWGVMIHNMAEWFIISRLWFGEKLINAIPAMLYLITFVIIITLCPLAPLWFIGMFQGAFCDYLLVYSAIFMITWTDKQTKLGNIKSRRKYMCAGFGGAMVHIISIQPLFLGMATAYSPLAYLTTLFILPTFVLYTYWASSGSQKVNLVSPGEDEESSDDEDEEKRVVKRYATVDREMQRVADSETDQDDEKGALVDNGRSRNNDIENDGKPVRYKDVALDIIARGVSNIDPSVKGTRNCIFIAALLTSLVNSVIVYMAPCYMDLSGLIDCD